MKLVYGLWFVALAVKLILGAVLPLSADEAYYWFWSHHLQMSFFDHPPFIAWLYYLGHVFEGLGQAVRWPGIIMGHLTYLIWLRLFQPWLTPRSALILLLLFLFQPLTGPGSLILTPDVPLVFFWSLAIFFFAQTLREPKSTRYLILLGLSLGLGFSSKYPIVLFFPCGLLAVFLHRRWELLKPKALLLVTLFFVLGSIPVFLWNWQNDFVSFAFQLHHGLSAQHWNPQWPFAYIAGQILLIFPPILILAFRRKLPAQLTWLYAFAWFPLAFFLLTSFKGRVEANWPIAAYPALLVIAVLNSKSIAWAKWTVGIWAVALALVFSQLLHPWLPFQIKSAQFYKYKPLEEVLRQQGLTHKPLFARTYQMASKLSYDLGRDVFKLKGLNRIDYFDFSPLSTPHQPEFYLILKTDEPLPRSLNSHYRLAKRIIAGKQYTIYCFKRTDTTT